MLGVADFACLPEFGRIRDAIRRGGTDSLEHFGNDYEFEGGLALQQNPDEFAALVMLLKQRGPYKRYLEIGSASGGAAVFICREVGFERGYSLDDGQHPRAALRREHFADIPIVQFLGDSHSPAAAEFLRDSLGGGSIDVAFIDGDHSFEGVSADVRLVLPHCREGTLLIFHDTRACSDVDRAWLETIRSRRVFPLAEFVGEDRPLGIGVGLVARGRS